MPFQILLKLLAQKLNCTLSGIFGPPKGTCTKYAASNSSTSGVQVLLPRLLVLDLQWPFWEEPILHLLWGVMERFLGYNFPKHGTYLTFLDEAWHIREGPWCALTQEKWGKSPHGFGLRVPKRVLFFFCYQRNTDFWPLSCTDFNHFWSRRPESVSACIHRWNMSEFLRRWLSTW